MFRGGICRESYSRIDSDPGRNSTLKYDQLAFALVVKLVSNWPPFQKLRLAALVPCAIVYVVRPKKPLDPCWLYHS